MTLKGVQHWEFRQDIMGRRLDALAAGSSGRDVVMGEPSFLETSNSTRARLMLCQAIVT
jgi:hypothetical protein